MLLCAEERAYISVYNERLEMFREHLEKMVSEGKKVVIITNEPFDLQGATVYLTECKKEQIRLITDSKDVLTGAITNRYEATSLYSSNNNLVEVFKDALANEIQLLNIQHHFIYMMKKESVKQQEDYTKHFHGIKDLKNILL